MKSFKKFNFCGKPFTHWKFVNATTDCALHQMKKCQSTICVKGTKCPVSQITVESGSPNPNLHEEKTYTSGHKFVLARDVDKKAIVGLKAETSGTPCSSDPLEKPQPITGKVYELDKHPQHGCGKYGDIHQYSDKIDSTNLHDYNVENKIDKKESELPFYWDLKSKTEPVNLYTIGRAPVSAKYECQSMKPDQISQLGNDAKEAKDKFKYINWFIFGFSIAGLVLLIFFLFLRSMVKFFSTKIFYILILIICLIVVAFCVWLFVHYHHQTEKDSESSKISSNLDKMSKNKCFQVSQHQEALEDARKFQSKSFQNVEWVIIFLFVVSMVFLFCLIVSFLVRKAKKLSWIPDPKL